MIGPRYLTSNIGNSLFRNGAQIRRNSSISIFNSVMMGWPVGVYIDATTGTPTDINITGTPVTPNQSANLFIQNTIVAGCTLPLKYGASTTAPLSRITCSRFDQNQRNAWQAEIAHLQEVANDLNDSYFFFEFAIPRMGKRVDVVIITGGHIFVIEYKVGADDYERACDRSGF